MLRVITASSIACMLVPAVASADPPLQEILARHLAAVGKGAASVKSFSFTYTLERADDHSTSTGTVYFKQPDSWRLEEGKDGKELRTVIINGAKSWGVSPTGDVTAGFAPVHTKIDNAIPDVLAFARNAGCELALNTGADAVADAADYRISATCKDADMAFRRVYFVDKVTYLIDKFTQSSGGPAETCLPRDPTVVAGITVPATIELQREGKMYLTWKRSEIRFNPALAAAPFARPKPLKGHEYAAMRGIKGPDAKWGFQDANGDVVVKPIYDSVWDFGPDGLAKVQLGKQVGFLDMKGKTRVPLTYDDAGLFRDGLAPVKRGALWGFLDVHGEPAIALVYEAAREFYEGLAPVKQGGLWGYIDKTDKMLIPAQFSQAFAFFRLDGTADVEKNGIKGSIDKTGAFTAAAAPIVPAAPTPSAASAPPVPPRPPSPASGTGWCFQLVSAAVDGWGCFPARPACVASEEQNRSLGVQIPTPCAEHSKFWCDWVSVGGKPARLDCYPSLNDCQVTQAKLEIKTRVFKTFSYGECRAYASWPAGGN